MTDSCKDDHKLFTIKKKKEQGKSLMALLG